MVKGAAMGSSGQAICVVGVVWYVWYVVVVMKWL